MDAKTYNEMIDEYNELAQQYNYLAKENQELRIEIDKLKNKNKGISIYYKKKLKER